MGPKEQKIKLFETKKIRTVWNEEEEEWYFSIVDVVEVLTGQPSQDRARNYWKVLKKRLIEEGNESVTNCNQLKLPAQDGKMRQTDVASTEQLFRLVQSIPSPKAEPFKQWLAHVAKERLDQLQDPELSIEQAMTDYKRLGYSEENLRDNMTNKELVINMLAELSTKEISEVSNPETMSEHEDIAKRGGNVAREARLKLEAETGREVVSPLNAKNLLRIE